MSKVAAPFGGSAHVHRDGFAGAQRTRGIGRHGHGGTRQRRYGDRPACEHFAHFVALDVVSHRHRIARAQVGKTRRLSVQRNLGRSPRADHLSVVEHELIAGDRDDASVARAEHVYHALDAAVFAHFEARKVTRTHVAQLAGRRDVGVDVLQVDDRVGRDRNRLRTGVVAERHRRRVGENVDSSHRAEPCVPRAGSDQAVIAASDQLRDDRHGFRSPVEVRLRGQRVGEKT